MHVLSQVAAYLQNVPEYMEERPLLKSERLARAVRPSAYIMSWVATEVPNLINHALMWCINERTVAAR